MTLIDITINADDIFFYNRLSNWQYETSFLLIIIMLSEELYNDMILLQINILNDNKSNKVKVTEIYIMLDILVSIYIGSVFLEFLVINK